MLGLEDIEWVTLGLNFGRSRKKIAEQANLAHVLMLWRGGSTDDEAVRLAKLPPQMVH